MKIFAWDDGKGPWGAPKSGAKKPSAGRRASGPNQPDIEDVVRQAQDKMKNFMDGNGGGSAKPIKLFVIVALALWLMSGFYKVAPDEEGVVLRFGKYIETTTSGLRYHLPMPIESVLKPKVTRENLLEIGFRSNTQQQRGVFGASSRFQNTGGEVKVPQESLMLTGDENIVDLNFTVRWKITDARDYLFNVQSVASTIKDVAESVMREVIGQHPIDDALTNEKIQIEGEAREILQKVLDEYRAGVMVTAVELQQVNPPQAVVDAFRDVQAAKADEERAINEAKGYSNDILPRARGQVAQVVQNAEAYKGAKIVQAEGEAKRFESQLTEYRKAKEITKTRLYIEAMEKVLKGAQKIIITGQAGKNIVPYLPLNELKKGKK